MVVDKDKPVDNDVLIFCPRCQMGLVDVEIHVRMESYHYYRGAGFLGNIILRTLSSLSSSLTRTPVRVKGRTGISTKFKDGRFNSPWTISYPAQACPSCGLLISEVESPAVIGANPHTG